MSMMFSRIVQEFHPMRHPLDVQPPGIYVKAGKGFGIWPLRSETGREAVPFMWATEFTPLGDYMAAYSRYWKAAPQAEVWFGETWVRNKGYWCQSTS